MEELRLEDVQKGQTIKLTARGNLGTYVYELEVLDPGERPQCLITQTNPDGSQVGTSLVRLEGTGNYTTKEQNPVQTQRDRAFTIGWGMLRTGGLVSVVAADSVEGPDKRFVFEDSPLTDIIVEEAAIPIT